MRLLLFADLHLDTQFRWAPVKAARARRQTLRNTLGKIVDLALSEQVDAVCCAGDLYEHEVVAPDTGQVLRSEFARLGDVPAFLAPGNHDWLGPSSLYAQTDWTPNVHLFREAHLEPVSLEAGFTLWGAAHCAPANTDGFLDDFHVDRQGVNVALFHGSLRAGMVFERQGKQPHAPFDEEQIARSGFAHALVGHFHTPRATEWLTYPGNPEALAFGEGPGRGAVILEFDARGVAARVTHDVSDAVLSDVTITLDGCASVEDVRSAVRAELAQLRGFARVTLAGDVEPRVQFAASDLEDLGAHLSMPGPLIT